LDITYVVAVFVITMPPRGKQLGVQEGSLLQLLRSAGFQAELPPSTVAWLENAPVFKFLSSKIGSENFVAPGDQQEYTEIMMAKGPNADLYDALGSGSDDEMDDEQQQDQLGDDGWMGAASDADVEHQVQVCSTGLQQGCFATCQRRGCKHVCVANLQAARAVFHMAACMVAHCMLAG
jgi:hypothetical protein